MPQAMRGFQLLGAAPRIVRRLPATTPPAIRDTLERLVTSKRWPALRVAIVGYPGVLWAGQARRIQLDMLAPDMQQQVLEAVANASGSALAVVSRYDRVIIGGCLIRAKSYARTTMRIDYCCAFSATLHAADVTTHVGMVQSFLELSLADGTTLACAIVELLCPEPLFFMDWMLDDPAWADAESWLRRGRLMPHMMQVRRNHAGPQVLIDVRAIRGKRVYIDVGGASAFIVTLPNEMEEL